MARLFGAVFRPTGEHWNFQIGEWVAEPCHHCFSANPDIIRASWGKDDKDVIVQEYALLPVANYRENNGGKNEKS